MRAVLAGDAGDERASGHERGQASARAAGARTLASLRPPWICWPPGCCSRSLVGRRLPGMWAARRARRRPRRCPALLLVPAGWSPCVLVAVRLLAELGTGATSGCRCSSSRPRRGLVVSAGPACARSPYDPWAAGAAIAVALVCGLPVLLSGEPTFVGSLVLGGHRATSWRWRRCSGTSGSTGSRCRDSSLQSEGTNKYVLTAYPLAPQAALGVLAPLGVIDLAWLYQPFLCFMVALTALVANALVAPWVDSRWGRAVVTFVAARPGLVVGFSQQGSIKEIAALAMIVLVIALAALSVIATVAGARVPRSASPSRWPPWGRSARRPGLRGATAAGRGDRLGSAHPAAPWRRELALAGAVILAGVVMALPIVVDASTAFSVSDTVLAGKAKGENASAGEDRQPRSEAGAQAGVGRVAQSATTATRRTTRAVNQILAYAMIAAALLGLILAVRRRAWGRCSWPARWAASRCCCFSGAPRTPTPRCWRCCSVVAPLLAIAAPPCGSVRGATGSGACWAVALGWWPRACSARQRAGLPRRPARPLRPLRGA